MSLIKVYIHFVWSTKNRVPYLNTSELRQKVWNHIKGNAKEKGIFIDFINGYSDHCHCLVSLGVDQSIQKIMQLIKGESSFWINKNQLTKEKFEWQDEYFAFSVSESIIDKVRDYIKNQEEHHKRKTFQEDEIFTKFGLNK
ncbi:IS200/IS605 family transposase [Flavobacterium sp.]|uniref:IS200/IS605 family transposase n=1 Tax=Flavobacterium sp. TaxID=239 RepID=UPI003263AEE0